jgi:Ca2+-transporting ATPase
MNETMLPVSAPFDRHGLTTAQVEAATALGSVNELPKAGRRSIFKIASEVIREPMLALLLVGGLAYLLLGNLAEALILLAFATFSIAVTIVQETRTEHVLDALRDLSAPRALVVRDGQRVRIAGRDVVKGDLLVLEQGDRVAADAVLHESTDLQIDESLLSGESLPVTKAAWSATAADVDHRPGGDAQPFVYSGSLVVRGSGLAVVDATGAASEIGKIGASLATLETEAPRLRIETAHIVKLCAIGGDLLDAIFIETKYNSTLQSRG